jgi:hypothetical protein
MQMSGKGVNSPVGLFLPCFSDNHADRLVLAAV